MTKNRTSEVLSANQLRAVKALIAHETVSDAAKACNLAGTLCIGTCVIHLRL